MFNFMKQCFKEGLILMTNVNQNKFCHNFNKHKIKRVNFLKIQSGKTQKLKFMISLADNSVLM